VTAGTSTRQVFCARGVQDSVFNATLSSLKLGIIICIFSINATDYLTPWQSYNHDNLNISFFCKLQVQIFIHLFSKLLLTNDVCNLSTWRKKKSVTIVESTNTQTHINPILTRIMCNKLITANYLETSQCCWMSEIERSQPDVLASILLHQYRHSTRRWTPQVLSTWTQGGGDDRGCTD